MSPAPTLSATTPTQARRRARLAGAAAVVAVLVHLWGLYRDHAPPTLRWFAQVDKLEHLVGFGLPCFLVLLALHLRAVAAGRVLRTRTVGVVVGLFVLHAGVSEVVQGAFYTTRTGDPYDALADVVGTALGLLAYLLLRRRPRSERGLGRGAAGPATAGRSRGRA